MAGETKTRKFRKFLRELRSMYPPAHPVRVRRVPLRAEDGWADVALIRPEKVEPYFLIRMHDQLTAPAWQWALIHEWAHCLSWCTESELVDEHDLTWALWYGRLYQTFFAG